MLSMCFYDETYNATGGQTKRLVGTPWKRGRTNPRGCSVRCLIVEKASTDLCPASPYIETANTLGTLYWLSPQVSITSSHLPPLQWWTTIHTVWTAHGVNDYGLLWTYTYTENSDLMRYVVPLFNHTRPLLTLIPAWNCRLMPHHVYKESLFETSLTGV